VEETEPQAQLHLLQEPAEEELGIHQMVAMQQDQLLVSVGQQVEDQVLLGLVQMGVVLMVR
jgi:hypothetical protein